MSQEEEIFLGDIEFDATDIQTKAPRVKRNVDFIAKKKQQTKNVKNTSNKGGYRPVLVSRDCLAIEAVELAGDMTRLRELYHSRSISDQDLVVFYIIIYLNFRYPDEFLENFNPVLVENDFKKIQLVQESMVFGDLMSLANKSFDKKMEKFNTKTLFEIINNFNLHSVPHSARFAISNWYLSNQFKIVLMVDKIPSSRDVLEMQSNETRCASLITLGIDDLILEERDPLSFLLHDLVHAYKMFCDQTLLKGQCGFCRAIMKIYNNKKGEQIITELMKSDSTFKGAFEYLISDMNSHPKHLFYYFKAILVNYYKNKFSLTNEILQGQSFEEFSNTFEIFLTLFKMNEAEKSIARKMLMPVDNVRVKGSNVIDFTLLDNYFINI